MCHYWHSTNKRARLIINEELVKRRLTVTTLPQQLNPSCLIDEQPHLFARMSENNKFLNYEAEGLVKYKNSHHVRKEDAEYIMEDMKISQHNSHSSGGEHWWKSNKPAPPPLPPAPFPSSSPIITQPQPT